MAAPTVGALLGDILPYLGVEKTENLPPKVAMEDFYGLTAADAERKLKEMGLCAEFSGTGSTVTAQLPAPGQWVEEGGTVLLYLK